MIESLFINPPVTPNSDDSALLSIGTLMSFSVDGSVIGVRWYVPTGQAGGVIPKGAFYRFEGDGPGLGTLLASKDWTGIVYGSGWNQLIFDVAIPVVANQKYVPAVWTQHYTATNGFFVSDVVNGSIRGYADGTGQHNGRFTEPSPALDYPVNSFNATAYMVDVLFFTPDTAVTSNPQVWDDDLHLPW